MITITVTSESSREELMQARTHITTLLERFGETVPKRLGKYDVELKLDASEVRKAIEEVIAEHTFNATELAEAEALGKSAPSTVDVSQSTTAHVDTTVNTSIPTPTSVFGQPAQATENVANPVVLPTDSPVLDANGLLWDKRIHSSSKELNRDGTWRRRRGVEPEYVRQVEAEFTEVKEVTAENSTQVAPNMTLIPPAPAETQAPVDMTFPQLLDAVTKAMVAGQLTQARINEALASVELTALPHLIGRTDLIPAFRTALGGVV